MKDQTIAEKLTLFVAVDIAKYRRPRVATTSSSRYTATLLSLIGYQYARIASALQWFKIL